MGKEKFFEPKMSPIADELIFISEAIRNGFLTTSPFSALINAIVDINLLIVNLIEESLDSNNPLKWTETFSEVDLNFGSKFIRNMYTNEKERVPDPLVYPVDSLGNPRSSRKVRKDLFRPSEELMYFFEDMAEHYLQVLQTRTVPNISPFMKEIEDSERVKRTKRKLSKSEYWYRRRKGIHLTRK